MKLTADTWALVADEMADEHGLPQGCVRVLQPEIERLTVSEVFDLINSLIASLKRQQSTEPIDYIHDEWSDRGGFPMVEDDHR
jgi:hypothetical protein